MCGGLSSGVVAAPAEALMVDALGVTDSLDEDDTALGVGVGVGERRGGSGLVRPDRKPVRGVLAPDLNWALYSMILKMFFGSLLEVMTVVTPAAVAISAAISLVSMPPVPKLEPRVVVLTVMDGEYMITARLYQRRSLPCDLMVSIEDTVSIRAALGSFLGLEVYKPSTSVSKNR